MVVLLIGGETNGFEPRNKGGREEETYLSFKPFFATPEDLSVLSAGLMEEGKKGGKKEAAIRIPLARRSLLCSGD